jgi:DNA-binding IclR family transcriptional regulator
MPKPMIKSRRRKPKVALRTITTSAVPSNGEYYSRAIGRALDVLECFHDSDTSLSLTDISRLGGLPESSVFRILSTLESRGYLLRTADGAYRLAPKLVLGLIHQRSERVRELTRPFLKALNSSLNETASLAFLFEDHMQLIDTIETFHDIRITNTLGRVLSPHCSSLGKAITAFHSKELIDRWLRISGLFPRTERTIVDRSAVLADLENVRKKGYAVDREESVMGGICFGAPIFDERRQAVAAISASTPVIRMSKEREQETIRAVLEAAHQASEAIQSDFLLHSGEVKGRTA